MKQQTVFISAFIILCLFVATDSFCQQKAPAPEKNYVAGEVLAKFHEWVGETEKDALRNDLNATLINKVESIGVEQWSLPEDISTEEAINFLEKSPSIKYAEPNFIRDIQAMPNDPFFNKQWGLSNQGQEINGVKGNAGADIHAPEAWDIFTGTEEVIVAVIDSGCAIMHPDLKDNIWINDSEYHGAPNFDDDGNGFKDDVYGWNFMDDYPGWEVFGDHHHGTHVSGIIATTSDNNEGIAGVSKNTKIMTLRVGKGSGVDTASTLSAYDYARVNGAKVINCSFGGPYRSNSAYEAISDLNDTGILVIAAAGNGGEDQKGDNNDEVNHYPSGYDLPNIISVAATDNKDNLATFSNFGRSTVDVAAPGKDIYSTTYSVDILYYENFDGNIENWTTGGTGFWTIGYNSFYGTYENIFHSYNNDPRFSYIDSWIQLTKPINLTGKYGNKLIFDTRWNIPSGATVGVMASGNPTDQNSWKLLSHYYGPSWVTRSRLTVPLDKFGFFDTPKLYIAFAIYCPYMPVNYHWVSVDDIWLASFANFTYTGNEYLYQSGTSMAAPVVSGIAALIWSQNPSLTHLEVKDAIMNSVDQIAGLRNKVMSGGRVNAHRALLMAGGAETTLYFPHIASNNTWETEICLINKSNDGLSGTLKSFDANGNKLGEKNLTLNGKGRRAIVVGDGFSSAKNIRYITLSADAPDICGYTKFYHGGLYRVAVPAVKDINSGDIYIPHIASDDKWWTGLALVNTTNSTKHLNITFNNGLAKSISLPPGAHRGFSIKSLFGNIPQVAVESAVITGGEGVIGLELFAGGKVLSGVPLMDGSANTLFFPHVASDKKWWTGVAAYNPNQGGAKLSITPYTQAGGALNMISVDVPAGGKYLGNAKSLSLPAKTAWFKIDASKPLNGFELFGTRNGNSLAGYSTVNINCREGVFPKLDHNGWTGIAFVNTSSGNAEIDLKMYDDDGFVISEKPIALDGYEKMVGNPEDIFSGPITAGTYLGFVSDKDVVGFQLNGSADGMMLDGLPGM